MPINNFKKDENKFSAKDHSSDPTIEELINSIRYKIQHTLQQKAEKSSHGKINTFKDN